MDLCPLRRQEKRLCNRPRVGLVSKAACRCARPIRKKGLGRLVEGSCKGRLHRLVCSFVVQKQSTFRPCNIPRKLGCCNHSGIDKAALRCWWWCCWCRFGRAYCLYKTMRSTTPQPSAQPATAPNAEITARSASTHLLDVVCCSASYSLFSPTTVLFLIGNGHRHIHAPIHIRCSQNRHRKLSPAGLSLWYGRSSRIPEPLRSDTFRGSHIPTNKPHRSFRHYGSF